MRFLIFPLGRNFSGPTIEETLKIGKLISRKTKTRDNLIQGIYLNEEPTNHYAQMNKALELYEVCHPIKSAINKAAKKGLIQGLNYNELIDSATKEGVVSKDQADQLSEYTKIAEDIINVDDFSQEEIDQIR